MQTQIRRIALALLLGGFAVLGNSGMAQDKDTKKGKGDAALDLHAIMNANKGKNSISAKINDASKGEKWDEAAELAKKFKELGEAITKAKPPKGDDDSWKKLSTKYKDDTAAVADAVGKKDQKAVSTAVATFGKSCKTCHDAHK